MIGLEDGDALADRAGTRGCPETRGCGADDIAEDRAGLHGRQLFLVPQQDEAGIFPDSLQQAGHQRQRHH